MPAIVLLYGNRGSSMFGLIRRLLLGKPLPSSRHQHERLSKFFALPVFASDALSSNAYATEEILLAFALVGAGAVAWKTAIPITMAIVLLLGIVVISYRLTIYSYPHGGGSYIVTKENLGPIPGLIAAGSLLTDYVLTVAVSVAAGIAAIISAFPTLEPHRIALGISAVGLVALMNLRGLRESGTVFAVPTYAFVASIGAMVFVGLYKWISAMWLGGPAITPVHHSFPSTGAPIVGVAFWFLVLRAFAGGCSAMTGTEAVADGIPAFKPPESRNAAATLVYMAFILGFLFLGISLLANVYQAVPSEFAVGVAKGDHHATETVVSQIARGVFGRGWFYFFIQGATAAILILAANTAFQDFPRLSSILAKDRFAPRQFTSIGDRLVFSNGILVLSGLAAGLIVVFRGDQHALIPLYAVGVFISFTLSQFSMSLRQRKLKQPGWRFYSSVSLFGSIMTGIVACVTAVMKFAAGPELTVGPFHIPTGAYIVLLLIPLLVYVFYKIHKHYVTLGNRLRLTMDAVEEPKEVRSTSIVLVSSIHRGIMPALEYARSLSTDCRALYIEVEQIESTLLKERWPIWGMDVPLVILESPYRTIIGPLLRYLDEAKKERPDYIITVVLPEFVVSKWWQRMLHNQSSLLIKLALMTRRDIVITNVRYFVDE